MSVNLSEDIPTATEIMPQESSIYLFTEDVQPHSILIHPQMKVFINVRI